MLIFQWFANSRIVREFPPFSFKVRIATLTRNAVGRLKPTREFESLHLRHQKGTKKMYPAKSPIYRAFLLPISRFSELQNRR